MAQTKASLIDLNSNELILDLDGDTTLHSSTDDQIDIKIAGADDFTFTAGAFNILASSHAVFADSSEAKFGAGTDLQIYHDGTNSFIANKTGALKIATETSGIAITIGHTTSEVTVADNLTVTGNANIGGSLTFADGSIALADLDIDGATDIGAAIVDADLFIVDDGAGGTNRKVAASRFKTYLTPGIFNLISSTTPGSEGSNITIDNCFTSTYDKYFITFEKLRNGNDESRLDMYLRVGGGSGSDAGTNHGGAYLGYRHDGQYMSGSTVNSLQGTIAGNIQNDTYYHGFAYVFYPTTTAINTTFQGQMTFREGSTSYAGFTNFGYIDLGSQAHTGFAIQLSSGNFNQTNTTINVYGITDAT